MIDVIKTIEKYREKKGWSVYKLALEAGLSQSALSNMYARGTLPSLSTLQNICDAFGISMSQFFDEGDYDVSRLTADEKELLDGYRNLQEDGKNAVLFIVQKIR